MRSVSSDEAVARYRPEASSVKRRCAKTIKKNKKTIEHPWFPQNDRLSYHQNILRQNNLRVPMPVNQEILWDQDPDPML